MSRGRSAGWTMTLVVVAILAAALATGWAPVRDIGAQRDQLAEAQAQLDRLEAQNAMLAERISALGTGIEVERIAREELGYVRPGETAFVVVDPGAETTAPEAPSTTQESVALHPWYRKAWDWLTGADLASG